MLVEKIEITAQSEEWKKDIHLLKGWIVRIWFADGAYTAGFYNNTEDMIRRVKNVTEDCVVIVHVKEN